MKTPVAVITTDRYLFQKIKLALRDTAEVTNLLPRASAAHLVTVIYDIDRPSESLPDDAVFARTVTMSRREGAELKIPFSHKEISKIITQNSDTPLLLIENKTATLRGETIKLTELEAALLTRLYEANGNFVSRAELLSRVFDNSTDGSILNVYIHYLREKLERRGEKIIISSRMNGYKIDSKYFGGKTGYVEDNKE